MNEERVRREIEEIEELREKSHKVSKQVDRYYKVQLLILGAYGLMLFLVKDKQIVPYLAGLMALISIINCIFFCRKMSKLNKLRKQLYDKEYELDRYLSA
jgi:hypothetical protein